MEAQRLERLRKSIGELGLEAILITNGYNRRYMTGFTGTAGQVLVTQNHALFLTDFRYVVQAKEQAKQYELVEQIQARPMHTLSEQLKRLGIKRLGFEQNDMSFGTYRHYAEALQGVELVPTDGVVEKLRSIKDEAELQIITDACDLADRTFAYILTKIAPGVTERKLALEMEMFMRENGAASSSFDTIVASGVRSALPHGVASDKPIGKDEFITFDFGAYYKGYCSDLTRTVFIGRPTDRHKEIYGIVLDAQLRTLNGVKPGMLGREGDAIARDLITEAGYGDYFGHGTGHSFGMQIHEEPRLSKLCEVVLAPGMTMTVEPGIYLTGFGGVRIEDDIVFTEGGIRILTKSPKEFTIID